MNQKYFSRILFFNVVVCLISHTSITIYFAHASLTNSGDDGGFSEHLSKIMKANEKWVNGKTRGFNKSYFTDLEKGQWPPFLYIGCADSRIPPNAIMGLEPGELFVHRNVANMVVNGDPNMLSALQFSVEVLKVKHILVCGHYGCGGIEAASTNVDHGQLECWLKNIRDVRRLHHNELKDIADDDERFRRLVELNVQEQCLNLLCNPIVQRARAETGFPTIQPMVYDYGTGKIKKLDIDLQAEYEKFKDCYSCY